MPPLLIRPLHTEADGAEEPEHTNNHRVQHGEDAPLHALVQVPRVPVHTEATAQDGEIERGVVVMNVSHTRHSDEGEVMQEPADDGVDAGVVEVVDLGPGELVVAALPADRVPREHEEEEAEREGRAPVDGRVAEEEVLDDVVVPAAHAQADVEDGPLPGFGGQVVLFVGVGDEGVVGGHHGDVQVHEVAQEGRFVGAWVSGGDWKELVSSCGALGIRKYQLTPLVEV